MQTPVPSPLAEPDPSLAWLWWTLFILAVLIALFIYYLNWKNRRLPGDHVFKASRLTKGNRIFPAQLVVTPKGITHFHPQWIGKMEESVHISQVASIKIDTDIVFSNVYIETSGGEKPLICAGHSKKNAVEMKRVIEEYQGKYYEGKQH